jgi:phosphonate transport system substrate-binding protein
MVSSRAGAGLLRPHTAARRNPGRALVALLIGFGPAGGHAAEDPIEFGLAPYISARPLLAMFQPLAQHLEARLDRPVLAVTAPTLREFDERALARQYDLAMMAPQSARLAQKQAGYIPLLRVSNDLYGVFVVPVDSRLRALKDLAREPLAFPDRFTATAHLGREALLQAGLDPAQVVYPPGFQDSLLVSLLRGEFPAALLNSSALFQMPDDHKRRVRVLEETRRIPHVMFVARQDMPSERQAQVRAAILEFMEQTEAGRGFIAQTGLTGVRVPTQAELRALDALAQEHKRLLEEAHPAEGAGR